MPPLISIIVPVYNTELYLDKCVQSILNQTYQNLEIILVDDGSTDSSPQKCDEYAGKDNRIRVIHKKNGGQSSARNVALDICNGDFIGFVDSDDWVLPTMYEKLLGTLSHDRMIATIGIQDVSEFGYVERVRSWNDIIVDREQLLKNILCHKDCGSVCTRLIPKAVIANIRFDESKLNEDVLFIVSIIDNIVDSSFTSSLGYCYLQRGGSTSRSFGQAVHDMIGNSIEIRKITNEKFPTLYKEAERFEIFQHMSFLLCCPSDYDRESDPLYRDVLSYIKKHRMAGLKNPHFTIKEKIKLIGVSFFPKSMSRLVEKKEKKGNESIKK